MDAELEEQDGTFTGLLRTHEAPRTFDVLATSGETVRLSLSPRTMGRVLSAQVYASTKQRGAPSAGDAVSMRELQTIMQQAVGRPGSTPARIARELEQRIRGISLASPSEPQAATSTAVQQVQLAVDAVGRAAHHFAVSRAAQASAPQGYFSGIVPTSFHSAAPSKLLAAAFELGGTGESADTALLALTPVHRQLTLQDSTGRDLVAGAGELRDGGIPSASGPSSLRIALPGDGPHQIGGRESSLHPSSSAYDIIKPSTLSRILQRFVPEPGERRGSGREAAAGQLVESAHITERPAAPTAFSSRRGEPGELSAVLQRFVPSSSTPSRQTPTGARRPSLLDSTATPTSQSQATVASHGHAQESLAYSMDLLGASSTDGALLGPERDTILERMAARGEPVSLIAPAGLTDDMVGELFTLGGGREATTLGERHETDVLVQRVEHILDRAQALSRRGSLKAASPMLAALLRAGVQPPSDLDSGLPAWRRSGESTAGVHLGELREMLRQVGAVPFQGTKIETSKELVNPYVGAPSPQADPLFKGAPAGGETKPVSEVQNQEQAFAATDAGMPPWEELSLMADEVYKIIMMKLRDEVNRRRSE